MSQAKYTIVAGQAVSLAQIFKLMMAKQRLEAGTTAYVPELSAPDGPSTGGGQQALQHIKLMPEGGGIALLMGSAHMVDKNAELRMFEHVDATHRQRFKGVPFACDPGKYEALLEQVKTFFTQRGFKVTFATPPPMPAPVAVAAARPTAPRVSAVASSQSQARHDHDDGDEPARSPTKLLLLGAVALAVVVGLLVFLLKR